MEQQRAWQYWLRATRDGVPTVLYREAPGGPFEVMSTRSLGWQPFPYPPSGQYWREVSLGNTDLRPITPEEAEQLAAAWTPGFWAAGEGINTTRRPWAE